MQEIAAEWIELPLPRRSLTTHKFLNGYLTAFVGSRSYPGAARLSCHAAARVGAGGVQVLLPESLWPLLGSFPAEIIPILLKEQGQEITHGTAFEAFQKAAQRSKALLVGCGIGRSPETQTFVKAILGHSSLPAVIDGDGLYALGKFGQDFIRHHSKGHWILTPHRGELQRLCVDLDVEGMALDETGINASQVSKFSQNLNVIILAKGFPSLIFTPQGEVFINATGNPAATTAGCGDVLAGIIAGYLAQGLSSVRAARIGLHRAGKAADAFVQRTQGHSLMASDIISEL
jgi:NAD(P)H-hydrate epimerase